ncbi:hypothetical protein AQS8620_01317 [Aquimixticola soesokkakensis]|uniref:ASCH domain-containing protein n=1 Tax=Aquimixticola soesokkakensis TaxID=1519096 RepID=A0A1Y5SDL3_9RHOB|nr:ASCH domain-containing protein [Aquimixticola soesokkakensis]SLN36760.1 hypothetical protein AQS8620_01317 [Aquimixticola soesokkakensis]
MVAYNFLPEFSAAIQAGEKWSTIRPNGKRAHARAGQELQLYTGMRSPRCALLLRVPCAAAMPIEIHRDAAYVNGERRDNPAYFETLAAMEGFANFGNMQAWFDRRYGLPVLDFTQIKWAWATRIEGDAA